MRRLWSLGYCWPTCVAVVLILSRSGCLWIAAGGMGGAAVGYAYYKGKVCGVYNACLADTWAATHTALGELGMPVVSEENHVARGFIESRTADGERVRIYFEMEPSKFPVEGEVTRVCVRIATFGDRLVSERILDQVGLHLTPVNPYVAPLPAPSVKLGVEQAGAAVPAAIPRETTPLPLLP